MKNAKKKRKKKQDEESESEEEAAQEDSEETENQSFRKIPQGKKRSKKVLKEGDEGYDPFEFDEDETEPVQAKRKRSTAKSQEDSMELDTVEDSGESQVKKSGESQVEESEGSRVTEERLSLFKSSLQSVFATHHAQSLTMDTVVSALHKEYPDAKFSKGEIDAALTRMQDDNQVMVSDQHIFLI